MYRVLHIMAGADAGGVSTVVLNYYRHLDRSKIQFDIALTGHKDGMNGRLLRELGADFYALPMKSKGMRAFEQALNEIFRKKHYDAIHVHENETSYVALRIAKKAGISRRIAHSHTSAPWVSVKEELKRLSGCVLNYHYATNVIGCGKLAGDRVFGKWNMKRPKAVILPNAIDTARFAFNEQIRSEVRAELALEGKFAVGMIGRLSPEKNHAYALNLMEKLHERMPEAVLLLVGNGEEEDSIRRQIRVRGMEEYVRLLGRRSDVARLYQGLDAVLLPSIHEGFPVAAVEAMASGVPVLLSDTITDELRFGSARYLKLGDDERWLRTLEAIRPDADRVLPGREVRAHGLDIRDTAKRLETLYLSGVKEV